MRQNKKTAGKISGFMAQNFFIRFVAMDNFWHSFEVVAAGSLSTTSHGLPHRRQEK